jgi:hypothetical protein
MDPCGSELTACEEKLPMGGDPTQCKDAYTKCTSSGTGTGPAPANPSQCDSSFSQCVEVWLMSSGDLAQCKDGYISCASVQAGVKEPYLDQCVAERDACEADDLKGCDIYFDDCVQRVGRSAMCVSAFGACMSGSPDLKDAIVCKEEYTKCAPTGARPQRPTRDECLARRKDCDSKGALPSCVADEEACLDLVLPTTQGSCEVDGVEYRNGDRLPEVDCNVLRCVDGKVQETLIACAE